jgi:hypothetical protein
MDRRPHNPDMIRLDLHRSGDPERDRPRGVSTRSRASAVAASSSVANWAVLGVGGFISGAVVLGLGLTMLPYLILPGAVLGLAGAACLGLSTLRQAPIAGHLWRFGDKVLAIATAAGLAAGAGVLMMSVSGLALVGQGFMSSVGAGGFGSLMMKLVRVGGATAVIGAVLGLTLYALHRLTTRKAGAF